MSADIEAPGRERLALALDTDDLVDALRTAESLQPWFASVKVGLELYSAAGPEAITTLRNLGFGVFADLKLHDIPTTVQRAARVLGALGASWLTIHAAGGAAMVAAGVEGLAAGADAAGQAAPTALAVTVLTSDPTAERQLLAARVQVALDAGCPGVVCAAPDLATVKGLAPGLFAAVPGIRPAGAEVHDQQRVATPESAIVAGADLLVIGRSVTEAPDPEAAAAAIARSVAAVEGAEGAQGARNGSR